jgi:hypothetical protein
MRLPTVIRRPLRVIALAALWLIGMATSSQAQYAGGSADGYARAGLISLVLDGRSLLSPAYTAGVSGGDGYDFAGSSYVKLDGVTPPSVIYTASASGGDGYDFDGRPFVRLDGAAQPSQLYTAGAGGGDGYDFSRLISRPLDGSSSLLVLYKGGSGDGYDAVGIKSKSIDPAAPVLLIYNGGSGDGYDQTGVQAVPLGTTDQSFFVIYTASANGGDGYDSEGVGFQSLDGNAAPVEPFLSSSFGGDGYDFSRTAFLQLNGEPAFVLAYLGGDGDGYDDSGIRFVVPNGALLASEPFAGGSGDGYDMQTLPFVQYLGGGEAAAGITFNGWRNSRFSEDEINSGLADPNMDADSDGLANVLEFALGSDPRVADALLFGPQYRLTNLSDLGLPALSDHYLTAIVRRNPLALDATLQVEVTEDPMGFWSTNDTVRVDASPSVLIVRDEFGINIAPRRLMRLRATLNP